MEETEEITLEIDEDQFKCQKPFLCDNSAYFEAMFRDEFVEKSKKSIKLFGLEASAMKFIIEHCHGNDPPLTDKNLFSVLQASGMLQFEVVRHKCRNFIKDNLGPSNSLRYFCELDMLGESDVSLMAKN